MTVAAANIAAAFGMWIYAWLAPIRDRRHERTVDWLNRPLLGLPEYAHRLGLTAKECEGYSLADALKERGWKYPHSAAAELRVWEAAGACDEREWRCIVPTKEREKYS